MDGKAVAAEYEIPTLSDALIVAREWCKNWDGVGRSKHVYEYE